MYNVNKIQNQKKKYIKKISCNIRVKSVWYVSSSQEIKNAAGQLRLVDRQFITSGL